jgi:hypothetical protein
MTKLVLMFPDSKTAQQFSGWLYLEGYPDRVLEQSTVTVDGAIRRTRQHYRGSRKS